MYISEQQIKCRLNPCRFEKVILWFSNRNAPTWASPASAEPRWGSPSLAGKIRHPLYPPLIIINQCTKKQSAFIPLSFLIIPFIRHIGQLDSHSASSSLKNALQQQLKPFGKPPLPAAARPEKGPVLCSSTSLAPVTQATTSHMIW